MELLKKTIKICIEDLERQIEYNKERRIIFRKRAFRLEKAVKKYNEWIDEVEKDNKEIYKEMYEYKKLLDSL